jgi:pimeloyl-ACP methyl ester carboxylesterase
MLLSVKSTCAIWSGVVKPADDFSLSLLVFDALALLDLIGADRAHIVGNSAGGYVSQQLAINHPKRVKLLALFGSTPGLKNTVPPRPERAAAAAGVRRANTSRLVEGRGPPQL